MKKLLAAALAAMMLLTACGGSGDAGSSAAPAQSGSGESAPAAADVGTATAGKLVVGMECNYAPFNWTQVEGSDTAVTLGAGVGFADGYDVVMAKHIAQELGLELVIKKLEWTGLEPALSAGEIDAIIAGMTATPERKNNADFTDPYYASDMVCIVRGDDALAGATSLADFSGKNVMGQQNTLYDEVIDQIPDVVHHTPLANYPFMVVALKNKETDALTAEMPVAYGVVAANPDLKIVKFDEGKGFQADTSVSVAVKKGNTKLLEALQGVLKNVPNDQREEWMKAATARQPAQN